MNYFVNVLWTSNPLGAKLIVGPILLCGFLALARGFGHGSRYAREEAHLALVRKRLRRWLSEERGAKRESGEQEEEKAESGRDWPDVISGKPVPRVDLVKLREGLNRKSLLFRRLKTIDELRAFRVRVSLATLQQLSIADDEAQPGLTTPAFIARVSMTLGILGTFLGLSIMVQEINLALPDDVSELTIGSFGASLNNLREVLSGMRTAFSTSLVGIAVAVIALTLDHVVAQKRAAFFERFEQFTTEELLPAAVPAVDDESLLERVTFQLEEGMEQLEGIFKQNRMALEELSGAEQACQSIVEEVRSITRSQASQDLAEVIGKLGLVAQSMTSLTKQLPDVVRAVRESSLELRHGVDDAVVAITSLPSPPQSRAMTSHVTWMALVLGVAAVLIWLAAT